MSLSAAAFPAQTQTDTQTQQAGSAWLAERRRTPCPFEECLFRESCSFLHHHHQQHPDDGREEELHSEKAIGDQENTKRLSAPLADLLKQLKDVLPDAEYPQDEDDEEIEGTLAELLSPVSSASMPLRGFSFAQMNMNMNADDSGYGEAWKTPVPLPLSIPGRDREINDEKPNDKMDKNGKEKMLSPPLTPTDPKSVFNLMAGSPSKRVDASPRLAAMAVRSPSGEAFPPLDVASPNEVDADADEESLDSPTNYRVAHVDDDDSNEEEEEEEEEDRWERAEAEGGDTAVFIGSPPPLVGAIFAESLTMPMSPFEIEMAKTGTRARASPEVVVGSASASRPVSVLEDEGREGMVDEGGELVPEHNEEEGKKVDVECAEVVNSSRPNSFLEAPMTSSPVEEGQESVLERQLEDEFDEDDEGQKIGVGSASRHVSFSDSPPVPCAEKELVQEQQDDDEEDQGHEVDTGGAEVVKASRPVSFSDSPLTAAEEQQEEEAEGEEDEGQEIDIYTPDVHDDSSYDLDSSPKVEPPSPLPPSSPSTSSHPPSARNSLLNDYFNFGSAQPSSPSFAQKLSAGSPTPQQPAFLTQDPYAAPSTKTRALSPTYDDYDDPYERVPSPFLEGVTDPFARDASDDGLGSPFLEGVEDPFAREPSPLGVCGLGDGLDPFAGEGNPYLDFGEERGVQEEEEVYEEEESSEDIAGSGEPEFAEPEEEEQGPAESNLLDSSSVSDPMVLTQPLASPELPGDDGYEDSMTIENVTVEWYEASFSSERDEDEEAAFLSGLEEVVDRAGDANEDKEGEYEEAKSVEEQDFDHWRESWKAVVREAARMAGGAEDDEQDERGVSNQSREAKDEGHENVDEDDDDSFHCTDSRRLSFASSGHAARPASSASRPGSALSTSRPGSALSTATSGRGSPSFLSDDELADGDTFGFGKVASRSRPSTPSSASALETPVRPPRPPTPLELPPELEREDEEDGHTGEYTFVPPGLSSFAQPEHEYEFMKRDPKPSSYGSRPNSYSSSSGSSTRSASPVEQQLRSGSPLPSLYQRSTSPSFGGNGGGRGRSRSRSRSRCSTPTPMPVLVEEEEEATREWISGLPPLPVMNEGELEQELSEPVGDIIESGVEPESEIEQEQELEEEQEHTARLAYLSYRDDEEDEVADDEHQQKSKPEPEPERIFDSTSIPLSSDSKLENEDDEDETIKSNQSLVSLDSGADDDAEKENDTQTTTVSEEEYYTASLHTPRPEGEQYHDVTPRPPAQNEEGDYFTAGTRSARDSVASSASSDSSGEGVAREHDTLQSLYDAYSSGSENEDGAEEDEEQAGHSRASSGLGTKHQRGASLASSSSGSAADRTNSSGKRTAVFLPPGEIPSAERIFTPPLTSTHLRNASTASSSFTGRVFTPPLLPPIPTAPVSSVTSAFQAALADEDSGEFPLDSPPGQPFQSTPLRTSALSRVVSLNSPDTPSPPRSSSSSRISSRLGFYPPVVDSPPDSGNFGSPSPAFSSASRKDSAGSLTSPGSPLSAGANSRKVPLGFRRRETEPLVESPVEEIESPDESLEMSSEENSEAYSSGSPLPPPPPQPQEKKNGRGLKPLRLSLALVDPDASSSSILSFPLPPSPLPNAGMDKGKGKGRESVASSNSIASTRLSTNTVSSTSTSPASSISPSISQSQSYAQSQMSSNAIELSVLLSNSHVSDNLPTTPRTSDTMKYAQNQHMNYANSNLDDGNLTLPEEDEEESTIHAAHIRKLPPTPLKLSSGPPVAATIGYSRSAGLAPGPTPSTSTGPGFASGSRSASPYLGNDSRSCSPYLRSRSPARRATSPYSLRTGSVPPRASTDPSSKINHTGNQLSEATSITSSNSYLRPISPYLPTPSGSRAGSPFGIAGLRSISPYSTGSSPQTGDFSRAASPYLMAPSTPRPTLLFALASDDPGKVEDALSTLGFAAASVAESDNEDDEVMEGHGIRSPANAKVPSETGGEVSALEYAIGSRERLANWREIAGVLLGAGATPPSPGRSGECLSLRYYFNLSKKSSTQQTLQAIRRTKTFNSVARLRFEMVGQERGFERLVKDLVRYERGREVQRAKGKNGARAPLVMLFCGLSGHGKTYLAAKLASVLRAPSHTVDMTSVGSPLDLWRSRSTAFEDEDEDREDETLAEFLERNAGQRSVVVLDEFDKALNNAALTALLKPWDCGRCNIEPGRSVDVRNTIFIATSNIGQSSVSLAASNPHVPTEEEYTEYVKQSRREVISKLGTSVESRLTSVFPFVPFTQEEKVAIAAEAFEEFSMDSLSSVQADAVVQKAVRELSGVSGDARELYRAVESLSVDFT